jgi:hypothetical protein
MPEVQPPNQLGHIPIRVQHVSDDPDAPTVSDVSRPGSNQTSGSWRASTPTTSAAVGRRSPGSNTSF